MMSVIRYKDPLSYERVDSSGLFAQADDCCLVSAEATENRATVNPARLVAYAPLEAPVCTEIASVRSRDSQPDFILKRLKVTLSGYRSFIGDNGYFNLDLHRGSHHPNAKQLTRLTGDEQFDNELSGLQQGQHSDEFLFHRDDGRAREIKEAVISLTGDEAPNFGAFLVKILPKAASLSALPSSLKVLVDISTQSRQDLLEAAGVVPSRMIHHDVLRPYRLDTVYVPSARNVDFAVDKRSRDILGQIRLRYGSLASGRKIYVSRVGFNKSADLHHTRVMTNETLLIDRLKRIGFDIVEPQLYSAVEQVRIFSGASLIVGPSGSGLFNAVFAPPDAVIVDIESEPHWYQNHYRLFNSLGLRFAIFEGEVTAKELGSPLKPHRPFTVDIERFIDFVASLDTYGMKS